MAEKGMKPENILRVEHITARKGECVEQQADPSFTGDPPVAAAHGVLLDRSELALVAVERAPMPMIITNPRIHDNPIVLANQAFLDLTGYSAAEVVGSNCRFLQGSNTAIEDIETLRRRLADHEKCIDIEILNYRKDGSTFWNQLVISAVHDEANKLLYYFASQQDNTALRRSQELEQIERLLLMELDHRSINALTLVQSIVRLSRTDSSESYSAAVTRRVDSLARAHRLLAQCGWNGVNLSDVVALEAPSALDAQGPSALVPATLVQPITLVFHELATNARQHGGLSEPAGKVSLRWEVKGRDLILRWHEQVTRALLPPRKLGLGLSLISGVIEQQLSGSLQLQWLRDGLKAEFCVPRIDARRSYFSP